MRIRFTILGILLLALLLAACDGVLPAPSAGDPTSVALPAGGTPPPGPGGPRANRTLPAGFTPPANFTPGGQRPGAQRTPQAGATNTPNNATSSPTRVAPTAVSGSANTNTSSTAPTAVPIPQVVIPTQAPPSSQTGSTPTDAGNTSGPAPAQRTAAPQPTATAVTSLDALRGKIVFSSDRGGPYPQLYVMEADGSNPRLCNCVDLLQRMVTSEYTSPDKKQYLYVKPIGGGIRGGSDFQIWAHHDEMNSDRLMTGAAPGFPGVDYDPVWSPDSKHIAWVSETNGFDEIYLYDSTTNENVRLTASSWEWYKHPSFSPDGSQIVFWSNRDTGTKQIWIMNLDGSNLRNISQNQFNDSDPIWVK